MFLYYCGKLEVSQIIWIANWSVYDLGSSMDFADL